VLQLFAETARAQLQDCDLLGRLGGEEFAAVVYNIDGEEAFDLAEPDRTTPVRFSSTQPTQALHMLNGEFLNKQAQIFADRLVREAGKDISKQVRLALYLATGHPPSEADIRRGLDLIDVLQREDGASPELARRYFCLMVLNLNEFVYLD